MTEVKRLLAVASLLALGCTSGRGAGVPDLAAVRGLIQQRQIEFFAAMDRGDFAAAVAVYAEDVRSLAPDKPMIVGREAHAAFWREYFALVGEHAIDFELVSSRLAGDLFYEVTTFARRYVLADGEQREDRGKWITVWERDPAGEWHVTTTAWSYDEPLAAAVPVAVR